MPLSSNNVSSISNTLNGVSSTTNVVSDLAQNVTTAVNDPFAFAIQRILNSVNSLGANVEKKIVQLEQNILQKTDNKGRVSLQGNTIVITVNPNEASQANKLYADTNNKIQSIRKTLVALNSSISALNAISTAVTAFQTYLTIQEAVLTFNPATGPIYSVFKKAIKLVDLKSNTQKYSVLLSGLVKSNKEILSNLSNRFTNLNVSIVISQSADSGSFISADTAQSIIATDILNQGSNTDVQNSNSDFTSANNIKYVLKIEKYGTKQLIGRAYDKFSGLVIEETAPSYFATPDDLKNELITILNQ